MTLEQIRLLARYNRWINERLYGACAGLSDEERRRDRGAFFRSIHGTLNHLLLADKVWLGRFEADPFTVSRLDDELHADFEALHADRVKTDARIDAWAGCQTGDSLAGVLEYVSIVDSEARRYPLWLAATHFFNHQTHHRGQLTTLLSQCGVGYGVTDLIALRPAESL